MYYVITDSIVRSEEYEIVTDNLSYNDINYQTLLTVGNNDLISYTDEIEEDVRDILYKNGFTGDLNRRLPIVINTEKGSISDWQDIVEHGLMRDLLATNNTKQLTDMEKTNMTEEEIINGLKLLKTQYEYSVNRTPGARSIYLASPWFNLEQANLLLKTYKNLLLNHDIAHIHVPLLHQYEGAVLSGGESQEDENFKYEWAVNTYKADVTAIDNSDLIVAIHDSTDVDSGTDFEIGYGIASKKPVVGVFVGDLDKNPVNLMLSFGVTSYVTDVPSLKNFDFRDIAPRKFNGAII